MNADVRTRIVHALIASRLLAAKAAEGNDGGSCNYDACAIRIRNIRSAAMLAILADAGLSGRRSDARWWKGFWLIEPPVGAMGARRTAQAEAMAAALKASVPPFLEVRVFYQLD